MLKSLTLLSKTWWFTGLFSLVPILKVNMSFENRPLTAGRVGLFISRSGIVHVALQVM